MAKLTRRKKTWTIGDFFEIPLKDGSRGVAQILGPSEFGGCVPVVFMNLRLGAGESKEVGWLRQARHIGVMCVSSAAIEAGTWGVIGNAPVEFDSKYWANASQRASNDWTGAIFDSCAIAEDFLNAYWGLIPWNSMFDPDYFVRYVLGPKKMPLTARVVPK